MTSIDRLTAQDATRSYVQNTEVARTGAAHQSGRVHHQAQKQSTSTDSVTLSAGARSLASARDAVQNAPDTRDQKVAAVRQQVSDGTYHVSAQVLARKMLDHSANFA